MALLCTLNGIPSIWNDQVMPISVNCISYGQIVENELKSTGTSTQIWKKGLLKIWCFEMKLSGDVLWYLMNILKEKNENIEMKIFQW